MSSASVPSYKRLDRLTLREQARQALRTSVITGELEPDRLYSVAAFAAKLGVSITPVREAVGDLANAGLVEIVRSRGFTVPLLTDHDLDEIFELRLMLEMPSVSRLAGQLGSTEIAECRRLVERGREFASAAQLAEFLQADRDFHLRLLSFHNNRRLVEIIDRLRDQTRLYGLPHLAIAGHLIDFAEEHASLLRAIEVGDRRAASEQMEHHLRHTRGVWAGRAEQPG